MGRRPSIRALVLGLVPACADDPQRGRFDVVPVHEVGWTEPFRESTVDGAEDILGLDISAESTGEHGTALMLHGEREGQRFGETRHFGDRFSVLWSVDHPIVLAREIGHALGLAHTDDPDNLMYEDGPHESPELTDEQVDTMREWAWWLQHC